MAFEKLALLGHAAPEAIQQLLTFRASWRRSGRMGILPELNGRVSLLMYGSRKLPRGVNDQQKHDRKHHNRGTDPPYCR